MSDSPPSINLIKNKRIPFFDKLLNWILSIGRLIVILTEVVAVIAFVYRFSLDDRLVNLHSAIKLKQNLTTALKSDENNYRNLQDRIALANNFSIKGDEFSKNIAEISAIIPNQAAINNLILNKDRLTLDVDILSVSSLASLIDSLKAQPDIKAINIDNISNKASSGLSVNISATFK